MGVGGAASPAFLIAFLVWTSARGWALARGAQVVSSELAATVDSAYCMLGLAAVAGARGEPRCATRLLGAAETLLLYGRREEPDSRSIGEARSE